MLVKIISVSNGILKQIGKINSSTRRHAQTCNRFAPSDWFHRWAQGYISFTYISINLDIFCYHTKSFCSFSEEKLCYFAAEIDKNNHKLLRCAMQKKLATLIIYLSPLSLFYSTVWWFGIFFTPYFGIRYMFHWIYVMQFHTPHMLRTGTWGVYPTSCSLTWTAAILSTIDFTACDIFQETSDSSALNRPVWSSYTNYLYSTGRVV